MIMGMSGGWNARSRRQLAQLARMNRIPAIELIRSLSGVYESSRPNKPPPPTIMRAIPLPPSSIATWASVYACFACMIGLILYQAYSPSGPRIPQPTPSTGTQSPIESFSSPDKEHIPTETKRTITHYSALVHEVLQAEKLSQTDPNAAIVHVSGLMPAFLDLWTTIPSNELEQIVQSLRVIDTRAKSDPQTATRLTDALVGFVAATDPSHSIAAAALGAYLNQTSGSPQSPFTQTLTNAARQLATESRTDDPLWWSSWIHAARSIDQSKASDRSTLVLDALSTRLRDPNPNPSWRKTASLFVSNFSWRPGSTERLWLLGEFADPGVRSDRLAPLTEAVATGSSASGVLVTMVLAADASMQQREDLAERYRQAWARVSTDPFLDRLTDSMLSAISLAAPDPDPQRAQDRFASLARLNAVCALLERGENAQATMVFEAPLLTSEPLTRPGSLGLDRDTEDDRLALSLINADSGDSELVVLYEIETQPKIGLNTAHAVVQIALTGSSRESRDYAARFIAHNRASLAVLLALDRVLFVNRTTSRMQQIIYEVIDAPTEFRGSDWDSWAHGKLLAAIAHATAGGTDLASGGFEQLFSAYYTPRLSVSASESIPTETLCEMLIIQYGATALQSTDPERVRLILDQRRIRQTRAESVAQRFAADQWAIVELHSLILVAQHPGAKVHIQSLADQLRDRCAQAQTIYAQITQLERAQTQLWLLHFREGSI